MSTQRSEISTKNKYWIPKHRYLELKNFCLQYQDWKKEYLAITEIRAHSEKSSPGIFSDPVFETVRIKDNFSSKISLVEDTAKEADQLIWKWLIRGVTESLSYEYLRLQLEMPAGREMYYDRYRKFFWILDKKRN